MTTRKSAGEVTPEKESARDDGEGHLSMKSDRDAVSSCPRARSEAVGMEVADLEAAVVNLARQLAAGTYELLLMVGELLVRGSWAESGALSCEAWLAARCDIELSTARRQVRVARAMLQYPTLDEAMADGDVSYSKARILVGQLSEDNVDALVEIARETSSGKLGKAIAAWCQRNEDPAVIRARQHEARSMGWGTAADGMVDFHVRLAPEEAAHVCAVIEGVVARRTDVPAGTTLRQQRADALVAVCAGDADVGRTTSEVVVHVRGDGNTLADGTPVSDHAVTEMIPDSFISLLILDMERYPIDASPHRRFPTRRQRRVIEERFDECQEPGCHASVLLQCDHIESFDHGGPTVLDNLQLLCGAHNRAKGNS